MSEFETSTFRYLADKFVNEMREKQDILREDRTDVFKRELIETVKRNELVKININAQVRKGKSTVAISMGKWLYDQITQMGKRETNVPFGVRNIVRDQQEYNELMRDDKVTQTVYVIDENSEMEKTGENATAESSMAEDISNQHAQRYVHTIQCSPQDVVDKNAEILLEVVANNKQIGSTLMYCYYRYIDGGYMQTTPIGYVKWNVKEVIKNWIEIEELFLKYKRTPEENKLIEDLRKTDFYVEYMYRKKKNLEYLTKEGVMRKRLLNNSEIILEVIELLKPISESRKNVTLATIRNFVKIKAQEKKIPMSIVGESLCSQEVQGVLEQYKNKSETEYSLFKLRQKMQKEASGEDIYRKEIRRQEGSLDVFKQAIKTQLENYHRLKKINDVFRGKEDD